MKMEPAICYICHDKRRIADTDTSETRIGNNPDAETLKEILLRALTLGYVEDSANEHNQSKFSSGVCIVSLSSRYDGGLEAASEKVLCDSVIICRRCESLLRDFEYHERTSAKIAEKIRRFLTRQEISDKEELNKTPKVEQTAFRTSVVNNLDERQGILAAFRALRNSGVTGVQKKVRKPKKDIVPTLVTNEGEEDEVAQNIEKAFAKEIINEKKRLQNMASSRSSKRIQRRREDGLVIKWGEAVPEMENTSFEPNLEADDIFEDYGEKWSKHESQPRKKRGRKPGRHQMLRFAKRVDNDLSHQSQDRSGLKYQCPFCHRYYIPSNSRIHNCTSYKNQLRCPLCNIFFTSYVRLEKHLEVIHLKQKQLECPEENCLFVCVSEPAFVLHKHFHFLAAHEIDSNDEVAYVGGSMTESDTEHPKVADAHDQKAGEVTIMDDIQGIVTSPDIADQVSFLLDEKSFLTNGQPINITTDQKGTRDINQKSTLQAESSIKEEGRTKKREMKIFQQETTPVKSESAYKLVKKEFLCPFCDMKFEYQKTFQDHVIEIHKLLVKGRADAGIGGSKKESARESAINKVCKVNENLKKNFNITPEDLTYTVERLKEKLSKS
ncbi:uncharacterized protein [Procambarus clarkii]|uniref:uncharacterized protein n=1 Tax=Procambarus clarkii TaxID=6728 RepID=UPI001E67429F|nr:uncharacterized protein LOC123764061 [Procambarus clarkii]XP_045607512.1 uncharacterized protein LOC123764061 [Procambarus clarkii]